MNDIAAFLLGILLFISAVGLAGIIVHRIRTYWRDYEDAHLGDFLLRDKSRGTEEQQNKQWSTGRTVVAILFLLGMLLLVALTDIETTQQYDADISGRTGALIMTDETTGERLPVAIVCWYGETTTTVSPLEGMDSIKVNETLPKSQVIEYRNAFGGLKRTELILGRDVEIVQKR